VYKKTRKHSALLLLMAPIIAIGSTALVAGSAASRAFSTCKGDVSGFMTRNYSAGPAGVDAEELEEPGL